MITCSDKYLGCDRFPHDPHGCSDLTISPVVSVMFAVCFKMKGQHGDG
jgi:hypothetical protein